jgi:hypothetical protein
LAVACGRAKVKTPGLGPFIRRTKQLQSTAFTNITEHLWVIFNEILKDYHFIANFAQRL